MTEKEIIQKIYEAIKLVDCMQYNPLVDFNYLRAKGAYNIVKNQVAHIEAENAELRARLEKAVELPFGNRVWFIVEDGEGEESYIISKPTGLLTVDELYEIGKKYFTTRAAAEKRLAELKGEKE